MYSAMILSVYGVTSKFSNCSTRLMVPLSELEAKTLNFAEVLMEAFLFFLRTRELHIFEVNGVTSVEFFAVLICHCAEGAKICAIFQEN